MKKNNSKAKTVMITAATMVALFTGTAGVAFGTGYLTWGGSEDFRSTQENLDEIERILGTQDKALQTALTTLTEQQTELKALRDQVGGHEELLNAIEEDINTYRDTDVGNNGLKHQLDLALGLIESITEKVGNPVSTTDLQSEIDRTLQESSDSIEQAKEDMKTLKEKTDTIINKYSSEE